MAEGVQASRFALETQDILGITVVSATAEHIKGAIAEQFRSGVLQRIAFLNSNLIIKTGYDGQHLLKNFLVLNDGLAIDLAGWLLNGRRFRENLNGTDFTPKLIRSLPEGTRIFLYGARPKVVAAAAERFASEGIAICGFRDGYACSGVEAAEAARLARAEVVLVAMGNPAQERWIVDHGAASGAKLLLAVGALFDFVSGAVMRAPRAVRILRLEWLFRLLREPGRLGTRYTVEMAQFFRLVLRERRRRREAGGVRPGETPQPEPSRRLQDDRTRDCAKAEGGPASSMRTSQTTDRQYMLAPALDSFKRATIWRFKRKS